MRWVASTVFSRHPDENECTKGAADPVDVTARRAERASSRLRKVGIGPGLVGNTHGLARGEVEMMSDAVQNTWHCKIARLHVYDVDDESPRTQNQ